MRSLASCIFLVHNASWLELIVATPRSFRPVQHLGQFRRALEFNRDKILQAHKKRTMPVTEFPTVLTAVSLPGARLKGKVGGSADDGMARTAMSASPGARAGEKAGAKPMARGAKASSTMERILPVAAFSIAPCNSADRLLYTVMCR
jgi:hypothetical protein